MLAPLGSSWAVGGGVRNANARALYPGLKPVAVRGRPGVSLAADQGIDQLPGLDGPSAVSWDPNTGLWDGASPTSWWQSALALRTLVRYLAANRERDRHLQGVLLRTYWRNVGRRHGDGATQFTNRYLDDTAWWGLAWATAAGYEWWILGDRADATRFLATAEADARYIASRPRSCGGIAWGEGFPPHTIADAEFVALAAQLARLRQLPGPFHDQGDASRWLAQGLGVLRWMDRHQLINTWKGTVADRLAPDCRHTLGGPVDFTQAEVAEAETGIGLVLGDRHHYLRAARFINYVLRPGSGNLHRGVLQQPCEATRQMCTAARTRMDRLAYKGIVVDAIADWMAATGAHAFRGVLDRQAQAVIADAITDGRRGPGRCQLPRWCQFGFYWARPLRQTRWAIGVTVATQASALDALTAALSTG